MILRMDFNYSPHREVGGALHFPSPSHNPHVDVLSAQTSNIRRSLSRSPSKATRYPIFAQTPAGSPGSPISPLALHTTFSPKPQNSPSNIFSLRTTYLMADQTATPKKKFSVRRLVPAKSISRSNSMRSSPMRRALGDASNQCNVTPSSSRNNSSGEENRSDESDSSGSKTQSASKPPLFRFDVGEGPIKFSVSRSRPESDEPARSTPLKRSDGQMDLGHENVGTPVKRRSLHGGLFGNDVDIFQQHQQSSSPLSLNISNAQHEPSVRDRPTETPIFNSFSSPIQKRPGPSRKSLHRQSQIIPRTRGSVDSSHHSVTQSSPATKARNRLSLDPSFLINHSSSSVSPFVTRPTSTTSTSIVPTHGQLTRPNLPQNQPHPLSRTLVPSSSGSSLTEDSNMTTDLNTHALSHDKPHIKGVFSKSLPIGALRPAQNSQASASDSFATPAGIKSLKQQPVGFMSTGLISKRNRHPGFHPYNDTDRYNMPDTPSKRASFPPVTATPLANSINYESHTPSGDPSTPFVSHHQRTGLDLFGKSVNHGRLFGADLVRRSSFVSEDGDDNSPTQHDSQSSADELPPTPTKLNGSSRVKQNSLRSSLFGRRTSLNPDTFSPTPAETQVESTSPRLTRKGKQFRVSFSPFRAKGENDNSSTYVDPNSPLGSKTKLLSFSRHGRTLRSSSPIPENVEVQSQDASEKRLSLSSSLNRSNTKLGSHLTVTPIQDNSGRSSPNTPQTSFGSPDHNNLSLSVFKASTTVIAPTTPTTQRDNAFSFQPAGAPNDVDMSIRSRFSSVSVIAQGEFSIVYRVEKPNQFSFLHGRSPPSPGSAWVVKKMKKPYIGMRDRENKLREVEILRSLKGCDHVLEYLDSWESEGRLYIQTEYCENGSLSSFLANAGNKARLDDFRVWKILLELSLVSETHPSPT
jgi:mitosis inhibitor protein kinase SWE1